MVSSNAVRLPQNPRGGARNARRGHVESHFVKAVSPDGQRAIWVKHTLLRPTAPAGAGVAEVWAIAFTRDAGPVAAAKSVYPLADARFSEAPFSYSVGPSAISGTVLEGRASGSGHELSWALTLEPLTAEHRPFPFAAMYEGPFPKQKALTPVPSARVTGTVTVDGERWAIDDWRGMQGHNWGAGHSERYAWVHCNSFSGGAPDPNGGETEPADTWFEAMTGRVRVGGLLLPWLTVAALSIDGEVHRFDGPRALTSRALSVDTLSYRTTLRRGQSRLDLDVKATTATMAGLHYENPDGSMTHCLNSKLATGTVTLTRPGHPPRKLSGNAFALEIGTKDPGHGIRMRV